MVLESKTPASSDAALFPSLSLPSPLALDHPWVHQWPGDVPIVGSYEEVVGDIE